MFYIMDAVPAWSKTYELKTDEKYVQSPTSNNNQLKRNYHYFWIVIVRIDFHVPSHPSTSYIQDPACIVESCKEQFKILTYTEYSHFSDGHTIFTSAVYRHVSSLPVNMFYILFVAVTCLISVPDSVPF